MGKGDDEKISQSTENNKGEVGCCGGPYMFT